tara:strand:- start:2119 stop:2781 length:663 start_codon:yes stop_codon:yes gene_type:complete
MKERRVSNRERIIETAIALMGEQGGGVGTSQIAEHLKISPGNLYYHFANREEIVREVLRRLRKELSETLSLPASGEVDEAQLVTYYSEGAMVLWRYRFMVSSALELTQRDPELAKEYREFSIEGMDMVRRIIQKVVTRAPGAVHASDKDCVNLAENMWVLWNGWPRHAEFYRVNERVDQASIAHGLELIAMTLAPYVDEKFHQRVKRGLHRFVEGLSQGL